MRINHDSSVVRICSQFKTESGRVFSLTRDARAMETFVSPNLLYPPKPIRTLSTTTDTGLLFRKKLLYLTNLNINTHKALSLNPSLRSTSLSTLISIKTSLSSLGLHHSAIGRILDMYPSLLTTDPNFTIYPVFDFLVNEVKIPFDHFPKSVSRCPRLLISGVSDQLRPTHEFLKSIGFVGRNSIDSKTCLLLVYGVESNLMVKIRFLEGLGFRFSEVKRMVVRSPGLLTLSVEKNLLQKVEYFLKEMNGDLKELLEFPQYFSFSLDRRIKLRHRKLVEFGLTMPLPMMLKASDGEFNVRVTELRLRRVEDG